LVRPKDTWAGLSAGISTGLCATLAATACGFGWAITMGYVLVPSLPDLQLLADPAAPQTPAPANAGHARHAPRRGQPTQTYPRPKEIPEQERSNLLYRKIVADQVTNSGAAPLMALGFTLALYGAVAVCGTLAARYLLQRGGHPSEILWPYVELTVPGSVAVV